MMFLGINIFLWIAFIFSIVVVAGAAYVVYWAYKSFSVQKKAMERGSLVNLRGTKKTSQEIARKRKKKPTRNPMPSSLTTMIFSAHPHQMDLAWKTTP